MGLHFLVKLTHILKMKKLENISFPDTITVNDPRALSNLGHLEYVLLDKTGTLTENKY